MIKNIIAIINSKSCRSIYSTLYYEKNQTIMRPSTLFLSKRENNTRNLPWRLIDNDNNNCYDGRIS